MEAILAEPDATKDEFERAKNLVAAVYLHGQDNPECDDSGEYLTGTGTAAGETGNPGTNPGANLPGRTRRRKQQPTLLEV